MRRRNSQAETATEMGDYFEYAIDNPLKFAHYGAHCWGLTACEGPGPDTINVAGIKRQFFDYVGRGVPYGPDDGTIAGSAALASLVFAPDIALPVVRALYARTASRVGQDVLASGFNATAGPSGVGNWISQGDFGFDQGLIVLMIESFRSGLLWDLSRKNPYFRC